MIELAVATGDAETVSSSLDLSAAPNLSLTQKSSDASPGLKDSGVRPISGLKGSSEGVIIDSGGDRGGST
jgi:hypothetical protein